MSGRIFVDSNLLIYAMDPREPEKRRASAAVIRSAFAHHRLVISPQTLNECYWVLALKRRLVPAEDAQRYLLAFLPACTAPLDGQTHRIAVALQQRHRLSWWDSVALASALQAGCGLFASEDMKDGQVVEGVRIVDPFQPDAGEILALH